MLSRCVYHDLYDYYRIPITRLGLMIDAKTNFDEFMLKSVAVF